MRDRIISKVIGQLVQDEDFSNWWKSKEISIPFLDGKKLPVTFMGFEPESDKKFVNEADSALKNFLELGKKDRENISSLVYKNCISFLDVVDFIENEHQFIGLQDENEIWKYVYPTEIYVDRRHRRDQDIYISIACECEWEQEHGLQLIFRQGKKITRISDQDGHLTEADAYDKSDEEDELLSRFDGKK